MSIVTAKIAFADETTSKIDGSPQIALKCKPTTGEPDFRVWVAATHKDQASLKPGGMILADVTDGKAKYVGLAPADAAQPAATPQSPGQPAKEPVTLDWPGHANMGEDLPTLSRHTARSRRKEPPKKRNDGIYCRLSAGRFLERVDYNLLKPGGQPVFRSQARGTAGVLSQTKNKTPCQCFVLMAQNNPSQMRFTGK